MNFYLVAISSSTLKEDVFLNKNILLVAMENTKIYLFMS